jgi:23S rRNA (guanosine2251-2'-O)-methyltransferase
MRRQENNFFKRKKFTNLIFGRQPVYELLKSDKTVDKVLLQNGLDAAILDEIKKMAAGKTIPVKYVPPEKLNTLTGGVHQGVIAFTSEIRFDTIEDVLPLVIEQGKTPLLLMLDGITDVRNFGAIARTAYAAGADAIIIAMQDAAPANAEAIKASAGALHKISICREKHFDETLAFLKLNGLFLAGLDGNASQNIAQTDLTIPLVLILGSEETGISSHVRRHIDALFKLPMQQVFDSYNVSVAAGMALYEVMRQRIQ